MHERHPRRREGTTWPWLDKAEAAERGIKLWCPGFSTCTALSLSDYENEWTFNPNVKVERGMFGELRCQVFGLDARVMFVVVIDKTIGVMAKVASDRS